MKLQMICLVPLLTMFTACSNNANIEKTDGEMSIDSDSSPGSLDSPTYTLADLRRPHEHVGYVLHRPDTVVLVSMFSGKERIAHYYVSGSGQLGQLRFVKNAGAQGIQPTRPLTEAERTYLSKLLGRLSEGRPPADDTNSILVSWNKAGVWTTLTYDGSKLTPDVFELCRLVGAADEKGWMMNHGMAE